MATFTPPTVYDNPAILPDGWGIANRLFRYYKNRPRYVMVFALSDGTFVQDTATEHNSNTNIPYPYNPYDPSAPFVTSWYTDYETNPPVLTHTSVGQNPWIAKVYQEKMYITDAEKVALTAAGYGALIT